MKIYFDGGCRPNPGQMSTAIVLVRDSGKPLVKISRDIGKGTNNIAEWMALVWAADFMKDQGIKTYEIYGDSNLIINQALGKYKTSDQFLGFKNKFLELTEGCNVTLIHVYRANNPAGHALEF
jgi:ribonuclease HI